MAKNGSERLVKDFLESQRLDRVADYVQRGRKYGSLSDDDLVAKWLASVKAMADAPRGPLPHEDEFNDAEAELALRKMDPPYEEAVVHFDRYLEATDAEIRAIQSDPKKLEDLKRRLVEDLLAFQDAQDRSN